MNGRLPINMKYSTTPKAQTSALSPLYYFFPINCGHMYAGVPQYIDMF